MGGGAYLSRAIDPLGPTPPAATAIASVQALPLDHAHLMHCHCFDHNAIFPPEMAVNGGHSAAAGGIKAGSSGGALSAAAASIHVLG
jgi:hypothetical protein